MNNFKLPPDVQKIIDVQSPKYLRRDFEKIVKEKFEALKTQMIQEFMVHPITQELLDGPTATNISGTLGGRGNLFSFIGFNASDKPIDDILELLNDTSITFGGDIPSGNKYFVSLPNSKDIFDITPLPWATGRSWAKSIETGLSGLGYYLFKQSASSRSGEAIQTSVKLVDGLKFKNTAYISAFINKYKDKFSKLQ